MRTGYFGFTNNVEALDRAGYDCIEMHNWRIMELDNNGFRELQKKIRGSDLTAEVFDNTIPVRPAIHEDAFSIDWYCEYMKNVVERTAELGARFYVFGCSRHRSIPEGSGREAAIGKNDRVLNITCSLAAQANITILLEPLGPAITNRFNTVAEIYDYTQVTEIPNIKTMLDYRWMLDAGQTLADVQPYIDFIQHVHIDDPTSAFPTRTVACLDDEFDYSPFFNFLKQNCYKGILSVEANTARDFEQDLQRFLQLLARHGISPYRQTTRSRL
ncbi:MAG: sugar phosphate isomerase/epimerase [Planctomycetaceae bacterium]|nr:sugar phosphate isomerase/epimerase [Planctomycetaceae bacterium]